MIKKYIRGHATRGNEVIAELEKLGGDNSICSDGAKENYIYFISPLNDRIIGFGGDSITGEIIQECFEEIKLPPLPTLPKTWKEYVETQGYSNEIILDFIEFTGLFERLDEYAFDAHAKLTLLRDEYRQGWKPASGEYDVVKSGFYSYAICSYCGKITTVNTNGFDYLLSFQSEEVRDEFYNNFRDLIEKAKDFI